MVSGQKTTSVGQARASTLVYPHELLAGKVFYLDLPSSKATESLENAIKDLGGTVEKFFSKEIKYLVSNKKEARYVNCLRQSSRVPSPDSGQSSSHPGSHPHKPSSHGDTGRGRPLNQTDVFVASRGKSLVDRVVNEQERVHASRILSNALDWGVKVLYVDDLRAYIQKKKSDAGSQHPTTVAIRTNVKAEVAAKQHLQRCKGGRINKPFVKVEDSSRHYRPIYVSLPSMPQFNLRALPPCSPFLPHDKDTTRKKLYPPRPAEASEERAQLGRKKKREKRGGGYCEFCMVRYENITKHLLSDCHQAFSKGDKYSVLDKVISTMHFNFSTISNQDKRSKSSVSSVGDLHLAETDKQQWSTSEGSLSGRASQTPTFRAAAAPSPGEKDEKRDDTSTDGLRNKSSGCKQMCRQHPPTSHTLKSSQAQMETALPPGRDDASLNVRTDQQEAPEESAANGVPEKEELSILTQTFSPTRKMKRRVRVYKRKRQKFESHAACVKQSVALEDSKQKLWDIFQSSEEMDVEFIGFKGHRNEDGECEGT